MSLGRVLVTGAGGFVARGVAAELERRGHPLTLATRRPDALRPGMGVRVAHVGDLGPATSWNEALTGVSAVVHCAAHVHVAAERAAREAELFDRVNRAGSVRLLEAAAVAGVRSFVFLSSITVLGDETQLGCPFDDESPPDPQTVYAMSKLEAERELASFADARGIRLIILRPPLICGAGVGGNLRSLLRLCDTPLPLPFGAARNRRSLLSLPNLADAICTILAEPGGETGTFVLADREPVSTADIVAEFRRGLGRTPRLWFLPEGVSRALSRAGGREGLHRRLFGSLEIDSSRFRHAFGWRGAATTSETLAATARASRRASEIS